MEYQNTYKILRLKEWHKAQKDGIIVTDVDAKDGFIHLSIASQLAYSLSLYFAEEKEVMLLLPKMKNIQSKIIYESINSNNRSGVFPHLYGKLRTDDIRKSWKLIRGAFTLPSSILLESEF